MVVVTSRCPSSFLHRANVLKSCDRGLVGVQARKRALASASCSRKAVTTFWSRLTTASWLGLPGVHLYLLQHIDVFVERLVA